MATIQETFFWKPSSSALEMLDYKIFSFRKWCHHTFVAHLQRAFFWETLFVSVLYGGDTLRLLPRLWPNAQRSTSRDLNFGKKVLLVDGRHYMSVYQDLHVQENREWIHQNIQVPLLSRWNMISSYSKGQIKTSKLRTRVADIVCYASTTLDFTKVILNSYSRIAKDWAVDLMQPKLLTNSRSFCALIYGQKIIHSFLRLWPGCKDDLIA